MTVVLRPVKDSPLVALVVLFSFGEDQDPPGKSGLAHLVEHVYVTAAAGSRPAVTVDDYMRRYPAGSNAQTGESYTVIATVFVPKMIEEELADAAARMGDLRVTITDLNREKPRVTAEVSNMFGGIPPLAARNHATERVHPSPSGARKGGSSDQVARMSLNDVHTHWQRYYKPANAVVVLTGGFDEPVAREAIARHFGKLPAGERLPAPALRGTPRLGQFDPIPIQSLQADAAPQICIAYSAPPPSSDLYTSFLVLAARLSASSASLKPAPYEFPVQFAPLDNPSVLLVTIPCKPGETPEKASARLDHFITAAIAPELKSADLRTAKNMFGWMLGFSDLPDTAIGQNVYGAAFSIGRRYQLGMDGAKLNAALDGLTNEQLRLAAREFFAPAKRAVVVVTPGRN